MRFFFYGTLLDAALRRAVCGIMADGWTIRPAVLSGYRRGRSAHLPYPFLLPAAAETVAGVLADGVDAAAAGLLTLYEGDGYQAVLVRPMVGAVALDAWIFLPARAVVAPLPWSLAQWRRDHKAATLAETATWRRSLALTVVARAAEPWRLREAGC